MRLNHYTFIIVILNIAGCATNAQNQVEQTNRRMEDLHKNILKCYESLNNDPRFGVLDKYLPIKNPKENIEQLANDKKPSSYEVELLTDYVNQSKVCSKIGIRGYASIMPQMVPLLQNRSDKVDEVYVQLIKKKISWGDALQIINAIESEFKTKEVNVKTDEYSHQEQLHNAEIAQRQRAAIVMQNAGYQMQQNAYQQQNLYQNQQIINNMNRPVNTTCNSFGSTVNCTSR